MSTLWPHQIAAVEFAADRPGTMLAMQMGTGKTLCAIHLMDEVWGTWTALVLCPKAVVPVWGREFAKHTTGRQWVLWPDPANVSRTMKLSVAKRVAELRAARAAAFQARRPFVAVVNYEAAHQGLMGEALLELRWQVLVLDECHRLKAPGGVTSRFCSRLSDRVPQRLGLTGTPMPHSPLDIYAQMRAIDKRVYGVSNALFKARYARFGGYGGQEVIGYKNLDDLHSRMYGITFRVRADEVLSLPEITEITQTCELGADGQRAYNAMANALRVELETGVLTAKNGMVKLLRLSQITGGHVRMDDGQLTNIDSAKARLLAEVLADLSPFEPGEPSEPVVVFAHFHTELDTVHSVAANLGLTSAELSGRRNELAEWQDGKATVLAVQESAGGLGVDMTRARYALYYSHGWSLGDYEQSRARIHRPGQTRPVTIIHLVASNTVDEVVLRALAHKQKVVDMVIDDLRGNGGAKQNERAA